MTYRIFSNLVEKNGRYSTYYKKVINITLLDDINHEEYAYNCVYVKMMFKQNDSIMYATDLYIVNNMLNILISKYNSKELFNLLYNDASDNSQLKIIHCSDVTNNYYAIITIIQNDLFAFIDILPNTEETLTNNCGESKIVQYLFENNITIEK